MAFLDKTSIYDQGLRVTRFQRSPYTIALMCLRTCKAYRLNGLLTKHVWKWKIFLLFSLLYIWKWTVTIIWEAFLSISKGSDIYLSNRKNRFLNDVQPCQNLGYNKYRGGAQTKQRFRHGKKGGKVRVKDRHTLLCLPSCSHWLLIIKRIPIETLEGSDNLYYQHKHYLHVLASVLLVYDSRQGKGL